MPEVRPRRAHAPVDSEDGLRLTGFRPGGEVRLRTDVDAGTVAWSCEAVFRADGHGAVDTARDAPLSGDWCEADPFGPYWSADLDQPLAGVGEQPLRVRATASDGTSSAEVTFERAWRSPDVVELDWAEDGVVGLLVRPAGEVVAPGVVHISGSAGGLGDLRSARLLAQHGIASLAIGFWNLPGLTGEDDAMWPATPLSDLAVDRARRYGAANRVRHVSYPDAGHLTGLPPGFAVPTGIRHPVDGTEYAFGGTRAGNRAARRDSWRRLVAFCRSVPSL